MLPKERQAAEDLVQRTVEALGLEVLRLRIGEDRHLIVTLDRDPEPVTLKDCTLANRRIRAALEAGGLPADDYAIDVESPGTDRLLATPRHFERFRGERVRVKLKQPLSDGTAVIRGALEGVENGLLVVKPLTGPRFRVELDSVAEARLDPRS